MARLGSFEELALLAVSALRQEGYGVTIQAELERECRESISLGAVYATLDRLEKKELVRSRLGDATAERGGRRKRLYAITPAGATALRAMHHLRVRLGELSEVRS